MFPCEDKEKNLKNNQIFRMMMILGSGMFTALKPH